MPSSMFLEKIRSEGLSHLSYIIGHAGMAAVVDPRRDCGVYVDIAHRNGARIEYIFETHRNEDYIAGSSELARTAGAEIYHGGALEFAYGRVVADGDKFDLGDIRLEVLETPGHTFESISIAVVDRRSGEYPVAVFTGDALFVGDVGRTDFFPDKAERMAGLLYDSIFHKILPLGDQAILCPAHGAGSVCGQRMSEREFSTLGMEKLTNRMLRTKDKNEFIRLKTGEEHDMPPYFKQMEEINLRGSAMPIGELRVPRPMKASSFSELLKNKAIALDVRSPEAIGGALIPGCIGIPLHMIPAFAGWLLPYDRDLLLVAPNYDDVMAAFRYLIRMGFDRVAGFLEGELHSWETDGRPYQVIPAVHTEELVRRIEKDDDLFLLDVRKKSEFQEARLPSAVNIYLGELPRHLDKVPRDRRIVTFCGSGQRAVIAATILKRAGYKQVENCLGSMAACSAVVCPVINGVG